MVRIQKKARSVDEDKCVGCGACYAQCPATMKNTFDYDLSERKAIDVPFLGALPNVPAIDRDNCKRFLGQDCTICRQACRFNAIDYDARDEIIEKRVGGIIVATGFELFDPSVLPNFGYGKIPEVYTSLEFERILSQNGPAGGKLLMKNNGEPKSTAIIHCVGSRDTTTKRAEHGISVERAAARNRSRRFSRMRVDMTAGTEHPYPRMKGTTLLPSGRAGA